MHQGEIFAVVSPFRPTAAQAVDALQQQIPPPELRGLVQVLLQIQNEIVQRLVTSGVADRFQAIDMVFGPEVLRPFDQSGSGLKSAVLSAGDGQCLEGAALGPFIGLQQFALAAVRFLLAFGYLILLPQAAQPRPGIEPTQGTDQTGQRQQQDQSRPG